MSANFDAALDKMLAALFESDDDLVGLRRNAARRAAASVGVQLEGGQLDESLHAYADKVSRNAYKVVDEDIEGLRDAGLSKAEIFDLTVGTAVGASLARLRLARQVIAEEGA